MTRTIRAGVATAALVAATPAFAAGTLQGTNITNNVTVSFQVGGVPQTNVTASDTFAVDRKINLTVSESNGAATSATPGQAGAVTTFTVTNVSNDTIDLGLLGTQQSGGAAKFTGTDSYDVTGLLLYRETNGTAGLQTGAGGDTAVTYLDEVAPDAVVTVYAVGSVPLGLATGSVATVRLTATAQAGGQVGTPGAVVVQTAGANTAGVDTVFADLATGGNVAGDGAAFDRDDWAVLAAQLTATKTSLIISDPINGTNNPKMIPGATVQYCIIISNAAGSATASNINLSDTLPTETTYDAGYGIRLNGSASGGVCNASSGTVGGSFSGGTVSGTLANIAGGGSATMLFRVTVQ